MNQQTNCGLSPKIGTKPVNPRNAATTFRLADGRPLWYTLLNDPNALVMDAADADRARGGLRDLFRTHPIIVRK
jgi:hypothetical protein